MRSSVILAKLATTAVWRLKSQSSGNGRLVPTVLCYHRVLPASAASRDAAEYSVTPNQFAEQMALLKQDGFVSLSFREYFDAARGLREIPERAVLVTFDDGFADNYLKAWPIAQHFGAKLNLFICTGLISGDTPEAFLRFSEAAQFSRDEYPDFWQPLSWNQIIEMKATGVGIGFHSHTHKNLGKLPVSEIARDTLLGTTLFRDHLGESPKFFAFPFGHFGSYSHEAVETLRANGIKMFFTTELGRTPLEDANQLFSRIVIHPEDDLDSFRRKLYGGYDWVGKVRRMGYAMRASVTSKSTRLSKA